MGITCIIIITIMTFIYFKSDWPGDVVLKKIMHLLLEEPGKSNQSTPIRKTLDSKVKLSIFMASDPCHFIQARMQYFVQKTFKNTIIACYSLCWDPMRHFRIWAFALWRKQHLSAGDFESGMPGVRGVLQWPCDKQDQSQARSKPKIFCRRNWQESLHAFF